MDTYNSSKVKHAAAKGFRKVATGKADGCSLSTIVSPSQGADYGQISEETWQYLLGIYGGGPEIAVRQTVTPADPDSLHGERKIEAETRAL